MILLSIHVNIHPQKQQEFMQTLQALNIENQYAEVSQHYNIYQSFEQKNVFYLTSHWHTRKALEQYFRTRHFGVLLGAMQVLGDTLDIQVNTISHTAGVEAIQAIRKKRSTSMSGACLSG